MTRLVFVSVFAVLSLGACKKTETTPPDATHDVDANPADHADLDRRELVDNWSAQPGDVTVCPISGKRFEVKQDSGKFAYQGYTFVFCCSGECLDKVAADPGKYLDALVEQAGGPATDPDPSDGGAIDDS